MHACLAICQPLSREASDNKIDRCYFVCSKVLLVSHNGADIVVVILARCRDKLTS